MKTLLVRSTILAVVTVATLPCVAFPQTDGIDPRAEKLLMDATTFLAAQERFTVDTESTLEGVLTSGQKIEFDFAVTLAVERPNKLRAERVGDVVDQIFFYDGSSLTLYNPGEAYYATVAAPATLEGMLDYARESLDIVAPAGDLVYSNAFEILMQDVVSAFVVGTSVVEGVRCHHLAFRNPDTDWQIWIEEGDRPLVRKMVITSIDVEGAPEFRVVMRKYNLAPTFSNDYFHFTPPVDATAIAFLPASGDTSTE